MRYVFNGSYCWQRCDIHKIGRLKIVQQDDGGPFVFLESAFPLDAVKKKKYIVMDVIVGTDASRK